MRQSRQACLNFFKPVQRKAGAIKKLSFKQSSKLCLLVFCTAVKQSFIVCLLNPVRSKNASAMHHNKNRLSSGVKRSFLIYANVFFSVNRIAILPKRMALAGLSFCGNKLRHVRNDA